ncbi:MAG: hypothetical protein H7146_07495 [Burkholderiaceae bacterium]|nr:hypothetical protein [Microbacteriaceae bacterium]
MRRHTVMSGAFAATMAIAFAIGGTATAATAIDTPGVARWEVPNLQIDAGYWTADRMKAAIPGDVLIADKAAELAQPTVAGVPTSVAGQAAAVSPTLSQMFSSSAVQVTPVSHIGKVFFTMGGGNYVCSGNAVSATNENTVSTAGHCLNEGPGAFATRFTFVPAYENGRAPFGQWPAITLFAPTQWSVNGDISYDTGFATVSSPTGTSLSDTVGASGVAFNQSTGLTYSAFGYPAAAPFTGETLQSCSGQATPDPYGQSSAQGIPCDMTGGSSGGPWFVGSGSSGVQNSVNSFGYTNVPNTMFGPYWGSVIAGTYTQAQA